MCNKDWKKKKEKITGVLFLTFWYFSKNVIFNDFPMICLNYYPNLDCFFMTLTSILSNSRVQWLKRWDKRSKRRIQIDQESLYNISSQGSTEIKKTPQKPHQDVSPSKSLYIIRILKKQQCDKKTTKIKMLVQTSYCTISLSQKLKQNL